MSFALLSNYIPSLSEDSLSNYLAAISAFPILEREEENLLAQQWAETKNIRSAHTLVTSHLRLVVRIAMGFKNYGLPMSDIISEGNIGLMKAVQNFDRTLGFRVSTYARWWIKASIHEYILNAWSMMKVASASAKKKLFFGLKKMKRRILNEGYNELKDKDIENIANKLSVSCDDVRNMDIFISGAQCSLDSPEGLSAEMVKADEPDAENIYMEAREKNTQKCIFEWALSQLTDRQKDIVIKRKMLDKPWTLDRLRAVHGNISRERIRQIESDTMKKLTVLCSTKAAELSSAFPSTYFTS